jgi:hypothetical protein
MLDVHFGGIVVGRLILVLNFAISCGQLQSTHSEPFQDNCQLSDTLRVVRTGDPG